MAWVIMVVACNKVGMLHHIQNHPVEFIGTAAVVLIISWVGTEDLKRKCWEWKPNMNVPFVKATYCNGK